MKKTIFFYLHFKLETFSILWHCHC